MWRPIVKECNESSIVIPIICPDGLEQQELRGMVSTPGYYHCSKCLSKGIKIGKGRSTFHSALWISGQEC